MTTFLRVTFSKHREDFIARAAGKDVARLALLRKDRDEWYWYTLPGSLCLGFPVTRQNTSAAAPATLDVAKAQVRAWLRTCFAKSNEAEP